MIASALTEWELGSWNRMTRTRESPRTKTNAREEQVSLAHIGGMCPGSSYEMGS